jgi:hypothetical protein
MYQNLNSAERSLLFLSAKIEPEDSVVQSPPLPDEYPLCVATFNGVEQERAWRMGNIDD